MRIIPSLLRVLLATSLVLNGLGLPMPAHALEMQHSQASIENPSTHGPAHDKSLQDPPCHGEAAASVDTAAAGLAVEPGPQHPQPDKGSLDCCDSGSCDGVCMQSAYAVLAGKADIAGPLHLTPGARSIPDGTPTPALPHPIRPPIG